ncbi:GNAT family N-acetyltransferase [Lentzea nigeriaca]|uniref:GNAT family N-acetyltransferase n=1 Tax=Lentzea nigeriaca TaxID=1128665 RepID=UPI0027DD76DA|nr:GNAT family N-acetyltransferase [Lentzea nigeriaca]MBM7856580.1 ribosomal protein S18 acetylase RimI-like enzyme [Lentzea nigeriaca]
MRISRLAEADRADWRQLVRAFHNHFNGELADDVYDQTWLRLLDGAEIRGIAARLDGRIVGFAHYYFHTSVWSAGDSRCYLQDLFVDPETRRRGIARALIDWVASDARQHGATRLHWHTTEDNTTARALYDKLTTYKGYIAYGWKL